MGRFDLAKSTKPVKNFDKILRLLWFVPTVFASQFIFVSPAFAEVMSAVPAGFEDFAQVNAGPLQLFIELNKFCITSMIQVLDELNLPGGGHAGQAIMFWTAYIKVIQHLFYQASQ